MFLFSLRIAGRRKSGVSGMPAGLASAAAAAPYLRFRGERIMPALVNELEWPAISAGRATGTSRPRRTAQVAAHLLAWPLLVKAGLLSGFAVAATVQHLLEV
jgi:hypothetical protein